MPDTKKGAESQGAIYPTGVILRSIKETAKLKYRLLFVPVTNNLIAEEAKRALFADNYPTAPSMCQQFARLVRMIAYHDARSPHELLTAKLSGESWKKTKYWHYFTPQTVLKPGDIVYKIAKNHVGIVIRGGNVIIAENSIVHEKTGDSRNIRTLEEFGHIDGFVRFPDTQG